MGHHASYGEYVLVTQDKTNKESSAAACSGNVLGTFIVVC
jgi:hypothetical protein